MSPFPENPATSRTAGSTRRRAWIVAVALVLLHSTAWAGPPPLTRTAPDPPPDTADPLPTLDLSAIELFWPVFDALTAGREPGEQDWEALFSTPAWQILGRHRTEAARDRYRIAFQPSRSDARMTNLEGGGHEAAAVRHLRTIAEREQELRQLHGALAAGVVGLDITEATRRAAGYLPPDVIAGPAPVVALAFFERDGYADRMVILDLLYTLELGPGVTSVLAHEFHHVYQARLVAPFDRPASGSADQVLLEIVFQLQREGVANLVDKADPEWGGGEVDALWAERFRDEVARSPSILADMGDRLERMARADSASAVGLAREIRWQVLPASGHPTGFHMARTIQDVDGRAALIATLSNPFDFVRAYNRAAPAAGELALDSGAMAVLDAAECRIFTRSPRCQEP